MHLVGGDVVVLLPMSIKALTLFSMMESIQRVLLHDSILLGDEPVGHTSSIEAWG